MGRKKKAPPPAKAKYDKSHPIVSVRLSPELKQKLEMIKKLSDKSVADVLKEAVGLQTPSAKDANEKGYLTAQIKYTVTYRCSVCDGVIVIATASEKKAVAEYMKQGGWRHGKCATS